MDSDKSYQFDDGQLDLLAEQWSTKVGMPSNSPFEAQQALITTSAHQAGPDPMPGMLLIIDTATTGLDPLKDECIEVGAILFNVANRSVLSQQSFLMPVEDNAAESINRIPAEVTRLEQPWEDAIGHLKKLIDVAEVLVAHNATFDRQWFGKAHLPEVSKPWLCTMEDICWPAKRQLRARPSVRDLALAYEVPVWNAHRALTDCIYLAEVFRRCDDLEKLICQGLEPRQLMRAQVSYEHRHLAKNAGFTWNQPISRSWTRRLSEREVALLDFPVVPVENFD